MAADRKQVLPERNDMENFISAYLPAPEILTPDDSAHYFFGYYDMRADDGSGRHLCHRVPFADRLPTPDDTAELGTLQNGVFRAFAKTRAFNFQQGAMLEYHPKKKDTVLYNSVENGRFVTVTQDLATGERVLAALPTACHAPDGVFGLSVNFGRIFAFRPGYGYAGCPDPNEKVAAPENDGVFYVPLDGGEPRLIISLKTLARVAGFSPEEKILINHITVSPDSARFVALVRNFPRQGGDWSTSMVVGDLAGNARAVLANTYVSHYAWMTPSRILAHCTVRENKRSMYALDVDSGAYTEYDLPYFGKFKNGDIHCQPSPDGRYIIGDGYEFEGYRRLLAYNIATGESRELFAARSPKPACLDIRCDLHARFVQNGQTISYDTTENGRRQIAAVPARLLCF